MISLRVIAVIVAALIVDNPAEAQDRHHEYDIFGGAGLRQCESDPSPVFNRHLTEISSIAYIVRWGTVQGGNLKNHSYLHIKGGGGSKGVSVFSPADAHLVGASYYFDQGSKKT